MVAAYACLSPAPEARATFPGEAYTAADLQNEAIWMTITCKRESEIDGLLENTFTTMLLQRLMAQQNQGLEAPAQNQGVKF